jgi:hypothetical protein
MASRSMLRLRLASPADLTMPAEKPRGSDEAEASEPLNVQALPVGEEKKSARLQSAFRKDAEMNITAVHPRSRHEPRGVAARGGTDHPCAGEALVILPIDAVGDVSGCRAVVPAGADCELLRGRR